APGRFSTMTGTCHLALRRLARTRATASTVPPASKGTTILTVRSGYSAKADADPKTQARVAKAAPQSAALGMSSSAAALPGRAAARAERRQGAARARHRVRARAARLRADQYRLVEPRSRRPALPRAAQGRCGAKVWRALSHGAPRRSASPPAGDASGECHHAR